ncbi:MAG: hypothetical protein JF616_07900 [Fibrobacteres bacterium]|jgi:hypothetical protein|nr:hypothetical protein [Fibrobacterota bacterium]
MNRFFANLVPAACLACLCTAGRVSAAQADTVNSYPVRIRSAWVPCEGSLGLQVGAQASRLGATSEFRSLVEPVPAENGTWVSPSVGAVFSLRWRPGFTLGFAPRWENFGLRTVEDTVSFGGNPYPHTLKSRTELAYNVFPLLAGMGWFPARHHFQVQLGVFRAFLDHGKTEWIVDGEHYSNHPPGSIRSSIDGWMTTAEYGFRCGPGDLNLGIEYQRSWDPAMEGLNGRIQPDAAQFRLAYAWILWDR